MAGHSSYISLNQVLVNGQGVGGSADDIGECLRYLDSIFYSEIYNKINLIGNTVGKS